MELRRTFAGILIVLLSLFIVPVVFAHGDEPRLEISVERVNPGGVVEVRGVDFEMDELVTLELVGSDMTIPQGEFIADVEGLFSQVITLPVDLKEGTYTFRATTDDHVIESVSFVVWGLPIMAEEDDGQREEDDALFAPMPTYAPGVSVTPMAVKEETATPVVSDATVTWVPILILGGTVLAILLLVFWVRRRRA